ncbi:MAG: cbb3-type cytochrome oxidase assembly protein CcoS [Rhodospirillales bacterium CG15_BIG_FIL_POST_REV_8_21_14_020_66_15]|nr:MAG: cbb3-type cytochrome oxidase assembly protein CcoS [Rhodospirillales bacterium CG15_BIG_FIL_POST_REV_8_21_14_020_66_15]
MDVLIYLIPAALFLGLLGLGAFFWALKSGQFEDLDGAAERILMDDDDLPPSTGTAPDSRRKDTPDPPRGTPRRAFAPPCH